MKALDQGYCDGLLGRSSKNPYSWDKNYNMHLYTKGYIKGKSVREKNGITMIIEDTE